MKAYRYSIFAILLIAFSAVSLSAQLLTITSVSTTPTTCATGTDGTITFSFTGGVAPYEWYIYEGGGIPVDFGGPTTETTITSTGRRKFASHIVVVKDINDNAATIIASVGGPDPINITSFLSTDITCNLANNGTITVTASGESGAHFFDLVGPVNETNTSGSFSSLPQGDYTVTVRDQGSCTTTDVTPTITINNPTPISAVVDNITDAGCFGESTGSIAITPAGGTPSGSGTGYTYAWTGPSGYSSSTEDIIDVEAGDYFVTITDRNGCSSMLGPYTVGEPTQINAVLDGSTDALCNGGNDGTASITTSGGAGGYTYSWVGQSNGLVSTDEDPVNLVADTYDLTILDSDGCSRTHLSFLTIDEPLPLSITVDAVNDVNCNGGNDGSVFITAGGGTPSYSFLWTGALFGYTSTDEDPSGMPADTYSVTITDSNGCIRVYTDLVTIDEPTPMIMTLDGSSDVSCNGGNDGSISITVSGGTPPYTFAWVGIVNGPASDVEDPNDLLADTYSLFIMDNNACFLSAINFVTIDEPSNLAVSVDLVTDVNCNGAATGAIDITPAGGTPVYIYAWTGPNGFTSTDEDLTGLTAGDYSLTITDGNGCSRDYINLVTINENLPIVATFSVTDLSCGDPLPSNNGAIDATVSGGIPGYTFLWTEPSGFTATSEDINGLLPGSYVLEVTDNLGCVMLMPAQVVGMPPVLTATTTQVDIDCFGAGDGSIDLTATGGTAPYLFAWSGPLGYTASTEDISNLEAGAYSVIVTDSHGCPVPFTDIATIAEVAEILVSAVTTDVSCNGGADGTIGISVTGGTLPFTFAWTGPSGFTASTEDLTGLAAGNYSLTITDVNGCVVSFPDLVTLNEPAPLTVTYIQQDVTSCFDAEEGSIVAAGAGGTGAITYSLDGSPPDLSGDFQNLAAGTYTLTLIDQNSCTMDTTFEILSPPELLIDNISISDVTGCAGDTNGSLVVSGSGGTGNLEYSLDDVIYQSSATFIGLAAGDYTIYLRDENGCSATAPATVGEPVPVTALVVKTDASFGSLGSISISGAAGGTPPYEYSIQGPAGPFTSTTDYTDLAPAAYHVVVRDQNGCTYEELIDILDIIPLDMVINVTHLTCFGASDGSIEFVPQDAVGNVEYSIDNGSSFVSTPLFENLAGNATYDLVAIDDAGKVFTGSVTITEPTAIVFTHTVTPAECNAFSETGAIDITVTGGSGTYTYLWSDGSTDEDRVSILAGNYTVQIEDGNHCIVNEPVTVTSQVVVDAYAGEDTTICYGESIQLAGSGDYAPVWEPAQLLQRNDILNPVTLGITEPVTFVLTISETVSPYGCSNADSITVSLHPQVGIDVTEDAFIISGSSVQLETTGGPFSQYRWVPETWLDNSTIPDPIASPLEAIRYYVFGLNEYGCEEMDSVFIDVIEDITVYNVFSPNGDGINEYFEIEHAERFPEMLVEVYSRWGDLFFSTVGYDSGSWWDGTARGKEAPVGTYYYVIVPYNGAKPITGHVTIIR
ncbi:MAG: gliding motility-associated C-terminal domain-containing protein [Bacteroidales bacterium]|nr:gliding motility-associated C-terminal domain-containing protein [Bacteroidales bacterium]